MQNIKRTIVLVFLATLAIILHSECATPEIKFPQLSAEVGYADVEKRIKWMHDIVKRNASFHELLDHPGLAKINNVPNCESNVSFSYRKLEDNKYVLVPIIIGKRSPKRSFRAEMGFYEDGTVGHYEEFMQGHVVTVEFNESGKISNIEFEDLLGGRKVEIDENGKVLTDTYRKFISADVQFRIEQRKQMEEEIQASIEAGYTATQLQEPNDWQLKLPEGLDDETINHRLTKIGEYQLAAIAGNVHPLLANEVFAKLDVDMRMTLSAFYSGKKVAFVGARHLENFRTIGFFMVFDEYAQLTKYVEGEIDFNLNLTGHEVAKSAKLYLRDLPGERNRLPSGLEITFHTTGYPANYKTVVKGELIGRQIEWDESGNVISDDDILPPPGFDSDKPVIAPASAEDMRTWRFASGDNGINREIEAVLVSIVGTYGEIVALENQDGTMVHVERSALSADDQEFVRLIFLASLQASGYASEGEFVESIKSLHEEMAAVSVPSEKPDEGHTTVTTITAPIKDITVERIDPTLPKRPRDNHWKTVLLANVAIIAAFIALCFYFRRRNRING